MFPIPLLFYTDMCSDFFFRCRWGCKHTCANRWADKTRRTNGNRVIDYIHERIMDPGWYCAQSIVGGQFWWFCGVLEAKIITVNHITTFIPFKHGALPAVTQIHFNNICHTCATRTGTGPRCRHSRRSCCSSVIFIQIKRLAGSRQKQKSRKRSENTEKWLEWSKQDTQT